MVRWKLLIIFLIFSGVYFIPHRALAQSPYLTIDTSLFSHWTNIKFRSCWLSIFRTREEIIEKEPEEEDAELIRNNSFLLYKNPDKKNYDPYAKLAAALWRAGRIAEAKQMFLKIEQSDQPFYTETTFHSSGTTYGYGSFTTNYKNTACFYLITIFIQEKKYATALDYLIRADKKYKIRYTCGTGRRHYLEKLKNYYAACYRGLGRTEELIDLYFSETFYGNELLISLLKKKYSSSEVQKEILLALNNITIIKDVYPSQTYMSDQNEEDSLVATTYSGSANTILFGRKVTLPSPRLEDGETISRELVIKEFKESLFYEELHRLSKK